MTFEKFDKLVEARMEKIHALMSQKREEYARRGDRLHNFKRTAAFRYQTPEESLAGMWMKHVTSIFDMIDDIEAGIEPSMESWEGKLNDNIIYTFLLEGLIRDRITEAHNKIYGKCKRTFAHLTNSDPKVEPYEPKEF